MDKLEHYRQFIKKLLLEYGKEPPINGEIEVEVVFDKERDRTRPNSIAAWELRIAEFRVFSNVEEQVQIVEVKRIGEKEGNTFLFRGKQKHI